MDNIEKDIAQGYADFADDEGSTAVGTEENIAGRIVKSSATPCDEILRQGFSILGIYEAGCLAYM